jgi:hypothetical protein
MAGAKPNGTIPQWGRYEQQFTSAMAYTNPFQDVRLTVTFTSPSGQTYHSDGFWDGGNRWRVRFSPNKVGEWAYTSTCSNSGDRGLHGHSDHFNCIPPSGHSRFDLHGPLRLADNRRYLVHADGTPFLWLGDTAWNGPLLATQEEWQVYLSCRSRQRFTVVQWVTTQWVASPHGDRQGELAFTGHDPISINPSFFQRLDHYVAMINEAGLLSVPVLLWSVRPGNPGYDLPEDQAILLARYMVARWGAHHVVWTLAGDGDYREAQFAQRWRRIGRAIFGDTQHAPVTLHPGGMVWVRNEFEAEDWYDIVSYQSGHGDDDDTFAWLVNGPPAAEWALGTPRPYINMEPPYEDHISYHSRTRIDDFTVRRALYWSLLISPTAGVTYGGHGVWGWDDGPEPPAGHPNTGTPKPWQQALLMPAAEQIQYLDMLFMSLEWWQLRPAPELLVDQPGSEKMSHFIAAARSDKGDLAVIYVPEKRMIQLNLDNLLTELSAYWFNPRTGERITAAMNGTAARLTFDTPDVGDWVLVLRHSIALPAHSDLHVVKEDIR